MAYPSKFNRRVVVDAALMIAEREGTNALTLRRVAAEVGVTANALYRHFDSRDALMAAAADEVAHRLLLAVEEAVSVMPGDEDPSQRVRRLLEAYAEFAEAHSSLYELLLSAKLKFGARLPEPRHHERLWVQSLAIVEPLVGAADAPAATVALWSLLHGSWALRRTGLLGGEKPNVTDGYASDAMIGGLRSIVSAQPPADERPQFGGDISN